MAKRPTSSSKKPRTKLQRVDPKRALALPEFEKLRLWARTTLFDARPDATDVDARLVRNATIVLVLLGTAARRFELCAFRCGDFRKSFSGQPRCYFESGKGNVEAEINVSVDTWDIVQRWLAFKASRGESTDPKAPLFCGQNGEHLSIAQLHNIWVSVCELVNVGRRGDVRVAVHMTRHTAGFLYLRATKSLAETADFMRHKSQTITERFYKHVLDEDVVAGLGKAGL